MSRLLGLYDGTRIFVSQRVDQTSIRDFFQDSDETVARAGPLVTIMRCEVNRLELNVSVNQPVF